MIGLSRSSPIPATFPAMSRYLIKLLLVLGIAGCSSVPPSNVASNARLTPTSGVARDLVQLPKPKAKIPVAVYGFRDQTGQYKSQPDSSYSTLVTQGASSILIKALEDSGWYLPVEREGLQNLLTERRIIRAIENPNDRARTQVNLPNLVPASLIIEGGVIAYESNVRTGGKGANYLGIGASNQYRVDQVTVSVRDIDVRTGQVLNTVSVTKTVYSYQFSTNIYKYTSYQHILQAEAGFTTNEPAQLAVREAIEAAVLHLTIYGVRDRYFELRDERDWALPVVQNYLAESLANMGEEVSLEDGALIPMNPLTPEREAMLVPTLAVLGDDARRGPIPEPRTTDRPSAVVASPAQGSGTGIVGAPIPTAASSAPAGSAQVQKAQTSPLAAQPLVVLPPAAAVASPSSAPTAARAGSSVASAASGAVPVATPVLPAATPAASVAKPQWGAPINPEPRAASASSDGAKRTNGSTTNASATASAPTPAASAVPNQGKEDIFNLYWKGRR